MNKNDPAARTVGGFAGFWQGAAVNIGDMANGYDVYSALAPVEGPEGVRQCITSGYTQLQMVGSITNACKDPALAMKWLDTFFSHESMVLIDYGFEGAQWEWNDLPAIDGTTPSRNFLVSQGGSI